MEVTSIRIDIPHRPRVPPLRGRVLAWFALVLDNSLAIHRIRLVELPNGATVLAFPSLEKTDACPTCAGRNPLRQKYCGYCGAALAPVANRLANLSPLGNGERSTHRDIAHPVTVGFRRKLEEVCWRAYQLEQEKPGSFEPISLPHDRRRIG